MANWSNRKKQHEVTASKRTEPEIPTARLLPIVQRAIDEHRALYGSANPMAVAHGSVESILDDSDYHVYRRMMSGGQYVHFNTADRLLTRLGMSHTWHTELSNLYESNLLEEEAA